MASAGVAVKPHLRTAASSGRHRWFAKCGGCGALGSTPAEAYESLMCHLDNAGLYYDPESGLTDEDGTPSEGIGGL